MGDVSMWSFLTPYIVIFVLFYIFLIIPQRVREKKNREMLAALKEGDNVITIGGIVGRITGFNDEEIFIITGENTLMKIARWSVKSVAKQ